MSLLKGDMIYTRLNSYKNVVAAAIFQACVPRMLGQIAAGKGKINLIIKNIKLATAKGLEFVIVVTNQMLHRQMNLYSDLFCKADRFKTCIIDEIT